jgi:hypothetical protein
MVPVITPKHLLVISGKLAWLFKLPEASCACLKKIVMKQPLMVASVPPHGVHLGQVLAAQLHVLEGVFLGLPGPVSPLLFLLHLTDFGLPPLQPLSQPSHEGGDAGSVGEGVLALALDGGSEQGGDGVHGLKLVREGVDGHAGEGVIYTHERGVDKAFIYCLLCLLLDSRQARLQGPARAVGHGEHKALAAHGLEVEGGVGS